MPPKNKHLQADVTGENSSRSSGQNQNNGDSSSNRRHKGNQESQTSLTLGRYTEHARQTLEKMYSAQKAIQDLSEQFRIHESEILDVPRNQQMIAELEEECRNKDEILRDHKGMNAILNQEKHDAEKDFELKKEELAKQREALENERKEFKKERATLDKRARVEEAEYKSKLQKEFEALKIKQDQNFQGRMEELDRDTKKKEEQNKAKLANLEAQHKISYQRTSKGFRSRFRGISGN